MTEFEHLLAIMNERDRRYEDRFTASEEAVKAALTAQDKYNQSVNRATSEAIQKAEAAQRGVNERSNEFRGQLADQAATLMPRKETETLIASLRELLDRQWATIQSDINVLKEGRGEVLGRRTALGLIISISVVVVALLGLLIKLT